MRGFFFVYHEVLFTMVPRNSSCGTVCPMPGTTNIKLVARLRAAHITVPGGSRHNILARSRLTGHGPDGVHEKIE